MSLFDSSEIFDNIAIRDQIVHTSNIEDAREFKAETLAIANGLDQIVTLQLQGSHDINFTDVWDIADSFTVLANANEFEVVEYKFLYYRVTAECKNGSPTSGNLKLYIIKGE